MATRYGRRSRPALQEVQQRIAEVTADVEENISGVRVVKAFAAEPRQLDRFRGNVGRVFDQSMVATRLRAFYNPFLAFLPNLGLAVILLVGGRQVVNGTLTLGDFTAFYTYLLMLIGPMRMFGVALGHGAARDGVGRAAVRDPRPRAARSSAAPRSLPAGRGRVELRDVTFGYGDRSGRAARRVAGGRAGLDGGARGRDRARARRRSSSSSRGCMTRARASVLIDGADVRDVDVVSLRSAIAVVDDDPFLFSDTVAGNIAYARPDASLDEIQLAAERAQAAGFIAELPDGYDTRVGERGLTLSGGQRQRIAIARAFLADPRVLILDDATSSVDATTEREIKAALREVDGGPHDVRDRPPAVHDRAGRRHRRARAGPRDRARHARRAARRVAAVRRDRDQGPAGPGLPQPRPDRTGGGAMSARRDDLVRRWRATSGRGRKVRGLVALLAPYRDARSS